MSVKSNGSVKPQPVENAVKTQIEWLVNRKDGAANFELRRFTIKPGGSIPKHYHPEIEHEQYVISGHYKMGVGKKVHKVHPGDSLFIPPRTVHWYENDGPEDAVFLCIIPRKERYETIYLKQQEGRSHTRRASTKRP